MGHFQCAGVPKNECGDSAQGEAARFEYTFADAQKGHTPFEILTVKEK